MGSVLSRVRARSLANRVLSIMMQQHVYTYTNLCNRSTLFGASQNRMGPPDKGYIYIYIYLPPEKLLLLLLLLPETE